MLLAGRTAGTHVHWTTGTRHAHVLTLADRRGDSGRYDGRGKRGDRGRSTSRSLSLASRPTTDPVPRVSTDARTERTLQSGRVARGVDRDGRARVPLHHRV